MWKFFNSRHVATNLLLVMVALLMLSTLLPSEITLPDKEWQMLAQQQPVYFWFASHCATPYIVSTPLFLICSLLLFLSTFCCTADRLRIWYRSHTYEFVKEMAFSFSLRGESAFPCADVQEKVNRMLEADSWILESSRSDSAEIIYGQKGISGFWGSILFHVGLLLCFVAAPVSYLTALHGELVITEGVPVLLREAFQARRGDALSLPPASLQVANLRGTYYRGKFKEDFGGDITIVQESTVFQMPFAVNHPIEYKRIQFSLHEFGYAPRLVIEQPDGRGFDFFLNLRHPVEGDYFDLGNGLRALVMFFPDFVREGGKIGSRSKEPNNPVTMVKIKRGNDEVFKGLFTSGEQMTWEGHKISVPEYRRWVSLTINRESGLAVLVVGLALGVIGLLIRFLCNERRIEFELTDAGAGTRVQVSGYSKYYPAFLEKEVTAMAKRIGSGQ